MKALLVLLSLFAGSSAFAQYVVRNGGYSIQCQNSELKALEIMEGEMAGAKILYSNRATYTEKAADLIHRLAGVDAARAQKYTHWLAQWKKQILWTPELDKVAPGDEGHVEFNSKNCHLRIAIVQNNERKFGVQEYWINPYVWTKLDENQKAALVLHELIYRDLLEDHPDANNSRFVRQVNLSIHTGDNKTLADLLEYL